MHNMKDLYVASCMSLDSPAMGGWLFIGRVHWVVCDALTCILCLASMHATREECILNTIIMMTMLVAPIPQHALEMDLY